MKTLLTNRIAIAALAVVFCVIMYSCQKENSSDTKQTVTEENDAVYCDETAVTYDWLSYQYKTSFLQVGFSVFIFCFYNKCVSIVGLMVIAFFPITSF